MDTTLLVNLSGQTYERLDVFEDIPITLTIQQSDLTDLTSRRVPYSNTLVIPDTSNNAQILEHYYEINGIDFNPLQKLPCVVQYRGTDIFQGVLRLNAVIQNATSRTYEVFILGEVTDFTTQIKDFDLQEYDWIDYNHTLNYSAVTKSWEAKSDTNDGIFDGDIIYPLVNYGLFYTGSSTTPFWSYDFDSPTSFSLSGNPVSPGAFKPAIRIKAVLDKIFENTDYNYVSDFFETDYFKSIYMDTFQNGELGANSASAITNQNIFKVFTNRILYYSPTQIVRNLNWNNISPDGYDPLNNFVLGPTNSQTVPATESYFRAPFTGDYFFNIRFNYVNVGLFTDFYYFNIIANKGNDPATLDSEPSFYVSPQLVGGLTEGTANLYFSGTVQQGEYVKLLLLTDIFATGSLSQLAIKPYVVAGFAEPAPQWDLYFSPEFVDQSFVDFGVGIPNINALDFFKSLITMFNLVVVQDETTKQVRIEPYNWYYNDTDRNEQDWTQRVDLNSDMRIEPLSFDLSKEIIWTNSEPREDKLNNEYFFSKNQVYGRYRFVSTNNIFAGTQEYVLPFDSVPTNSLAGAPNIIIPEFYQLTNGLQQPYATKPHLFFWVGNRYSYTDVNKTIPGYWYLSSGGTAVQQTTYPAVSHLSSLDIQLPALVSDLNFDSAFDYFGNFNNQIPQFTPYNVFNLFWADYIDNIYSPETRRMTCRVFFNPIDLYQTSLKDKIFIKEANYTIEKITDADLVNRKLTQVSLIKDRVPYYKIIPPAPVYALSGNTPYPGVEPIYTTLCWVDFDNDAVCNETAPLITIYTFGTGTIQNWDKVYYDTGTSLKLLEQGYYLKQQGIPSPDTFVVVDNYGRILEQPC